MKRSPKTSAFVAVLALAAIPSQAFAWGLDSLSNAVDKASTAQDTADTAKAAAADPTYAGSVAAQKQAGVYGTANEAKATANGVKDDANTVAPTTPRQPASQ